MYTVSQLGGDSVPLVCGLSHSLAGTGVQVKVGLVWSLKLADLSGSLSALLARNHFPSSLKLKKI